MIGFEQRSFFLQWAALNLGAEAHFELTSNSETPDPKLLEGLTPEQKKLVLEALQKAQQAQTQSTSQTTREKGSATKTAKQSHSEEVKASSSVWGLALGLAVAFVVLAGAMTYLGQ